MNVYVLGAVWVLGAAAVAALGTILAHRLRSGDSNANDAVGGVFTIVAGLQAVLMAFVLISLFDTVNSVGDGAYTEANALVGVHWASDSLPAPVREQVWELSSSYASTVAEDEWPSMRDGEPVAATGWDLLERMRVAIDGAPADTQWQQDRKAEAKSQLWAVYQARQDRLATAGDAGVSPVVWFVLIAGSILSILLVYLFDVSKMLTHLAIISTLAATIALLMFSIHQLQNPFSEGLVDPAAFTSAIDRMPST